jgi:hypothetical protein
MKIFEDILDSNILKISDNSGGEGFIGHLEIDI